MISTAAATLNNGLQMPRIGFGAFQIPQGEAAYNAVRTTPKLGCRSLDTAAVYGNEEEVGRVIRHSGIDPSDIFVTTKVWTSDRGYDNSLRAFEESKKPARNSGSHTSSHTAGEPDRVSSIQRSGGIARGLIRCTPLARA